MVLVATCWQTALPLALQLLLLVLLALLLLHEAEEPVVVTVVQPFPREVGPALQVETALVAL